MTRYFITTGLYAKYCCNGHAILRFDWIKQRVITVPKNAECMCPGNAT